VARLKMLQARGQLMLCAETKTCILSPSGRTQPGNTSTRWAGRLVAIAFILCLPISANADIVSGRVYDPGGTVLPNTTFVVETGKGEAGKFKTDESGNFSVYLDPGRYTVHPLREGKPDRSLEGILESYPQSAHEDIRLKKRK
jgi:hypothetical protein